MTDRPILFSAPMIRALLERRKTQTRRLASSKPMQRVQVGDRLWVRENLFCPNGADWWYRADDGEISLHRSDPRVGKMVAWARQKTGEVCNSIHMPRWASRLTLTVTETRTQPLQWITEADARAEGIERVEMYPGSSHFNDHEGRTFAFPQFAYASLWTALHPKPGERWEDNPDVIALTFKVEQRNVDA